MLHRNGRRPLVSDLKALEGELERTRRAIGVAGRKIPGGRRDDLVAQDVTVAKCRPMAQGAARRFDEAGDGTIPRGAILRAKGLGELQIARPVLGGLRQNRDFEKPRRHPRKDIGRASAPTSTARPASRGALAKE